MLSLYVALRTSMSMHSHAVTGCAVCCACLTCKGSSDAVVDNMACIAGYGTACSNLVTLANQLTNTWFV